MTFLSRGHGFGHAARDERIIEELYALEPGLRLTLASSGSGATFFAQRGRDFVDLGFPDSEDHGTDAVWAVWRLLHEARDTDVVVSDEFFHAAPFARRVLGRPVVVLTDWFGAEFGAPDADEPLRDASEVIVTDFPEVHPVLPYLDVPVTVSGPIVRRFGSTGRDLPGLGGRPGLLGVVSMGGRPDRRRGLEMLRAVLRAWGRRPRDGRLVILCDPPVRAVVEDPSVVWVGRVHDPEAYYAAADFVVCDGTGFTVCDLAHNDVPSVALLPVGLDGNERTQVSARLRAVSALGPVGVVDAREPERFWGVLERVLDRPRTAEAELAGAAWGQARAVATRILAHARPSAVVGGVR
ncbi:hypothetical protein JOE63_001802 [Cellulosimicrobium cellulans]|jgi:hypothetical protein|nr:glycosyl transferase [Cellulosimicrobium cellulans]MBM7819325.1 hypothetical protein [Cellulosimicrobium cellulans]